MAIRPPWMKRLCACAAHLAVPRYPEAGRAGGPQAGLLTQELNRETNTIGSKCQDLDITRIVVDMKAEIEKIREQIQNLE